MIWVKNAGFVPFVYIALSYLLDDHLLATAAAIRTFTINYFFWFHEWSIKGQLRQWVRFTDSQTILCVANHCHKDTTYEELVGQVTRNVLGLVMVGFWVAKSIGIDETLSQPDYPFLYREICDLYHYINHGLLFALFFAQLPNQHTPFNENATLVGIKYTLLYMLFYIMLIYVPWYFVTGDRIYDV